MPDMQEDRDMVKRYEYFCNSCGFEIVVTGYYHDICPLCGYPLGRRTPTRTRAEIKQSAKEIKTNGRKETGTIREARR